MAPDIESVLPVSPTRAANDNTNPFVHRRVDGSGNVAPAGDAVGRASFTRVTDGTNTMPTLDAVGRSGYVRITDGTNTMPTGDAAARGIYHRITDGTNTAAVKAASTQAAATDPALVVRPMAYTDGTNVAPTMDAAGRRGFVSVTDGTNTQPTGDAAARGIYHRITDGTNTATVKAASTQALATDTALVVRPMMPTDGTNVQPVGDAAARASYVRVTDGTNTQVTFDVAARAGFVRLTDGTNPLGTLANPIYVYQTNAIVSANEVQDYDTTASVASGATDNHDYAAVTTTFLLQRVWASASGAMKVVVSAGPVAALVVKAVGFTSMANPNLDIEFDPPLEVPTTSTGTVRVARTNRELSAMDVYSTIFGRQT